MLTSHFILRSSKYWYGRSLFKLCLQNTELSFSFFFFSYTDLGCSVLVLRLSQSLRVCIYGCLYIARCIYSCESGTATP